jgi:hypothetical protein
VNFSKLNTIWDCIQTFNVSKTDHSAADEYVLAIKRLENKWYVCKVVGFLSIDLKNLCS